MIRPSKSKLATFVSLGIGIVLGAGCDSPKASFIDEEVEEYQSSDGIANQVDAEYNSQENTENDNEGRCHRPQNDHQCVDIHIHGMIPKRVNVRTIVMPGRAVTSRYRQVDQIHVTPQGEDRTDESRTLVPTMLHAPAS